MTSRPSSRRSPWWRSASTKTSWPTSAVTTGAVCCQPVHFMRGIPSIVGGIWLFIFPTLLLDFSPTLKCLVRLLVACIFFRILGSVCLLVCDTGCFNVVFHNEDKSCVCLSRNTKLWICMEYCGGGSLQDMYHGLYCIQINVKYSYCRY